MAATIPAPTMPEHRLICRVCEKQYSKYTCPRCNLRYCSLACYKNHSSRCTESFMRDNVTEEMRYIRATKDSQQSMLEVLKRIHFDEAGRSILEDSLTDENMEDEDSNENRGTVFSEKTLQLIAGGEISFENLSVAEQKAFLRAVAGGEISHLIQPWNPWWLNPRAKAISITKQGTSLVQPVHPLDEKTEDERSRSEETQPMPSEVPAPPFEALAKVRQLVPVDPSPLLSVHLGEVIFSYCFTLRYFNGDWQSEPWEAALVILTVSQVLGQAASPESVGVALGDTVTSVCSPAFKHAGGFKFAVSLFEDSATILRLGRACVVCALADLYRMLENSKKDLKGEMRLEKQDRVKHEGRCSSGSTVKEKQSTNSGASLNVYSGGVNRKDSQGSTFADLRKMRDTKRGLSRDRTQSKREEEELSTGSNVVTGFKASSSSRKPVAISDGQRQGRGNVDLRRIAAAIRKVYFLMCWTNEQSEEVFMSLASVIDNEKSRLLETTGIKNLGFCTVNKEKAWVTEKGPIIEEIAGPSGQEP